MPVDALLLATTAVLAVVTVGAAIVAVRASREARRLRAQPAPAPEPAGPREVAVVDESRPQPVEDRVIEGRVIVPVTQEQLVAAELSRPRARVAIVSAGLAHALRPESRRRIAVVARSEYRLRRRSRLRAGRRAARAANEPRQPQQPEGWLSS